MGAQPVSLRKPSRLQIGWILPLVPVALAVFFVSSLSCYHVEVSGSPFAGETLLQQLVVSVYRFFGFVPAMMLSVMVLIWSSIWFLTGRLERPLGRVLRIMGFVLSLAIVVNLGTETHSGWIGETLAVPLDTVFGGALSTLLAAIAALASLMLATDFLFYGHFDSLSRRSQAAPAEGLPGVESEAIDELRSLSLEEASAKTPAYSPVAESVASPGGLSAFHGHGQVE